MITKVDSTNFDLYTKFFAEAYQYLEELESEEDPIIATEDRNDEKTFTSIAQYFKYIENFKSSPRRDYFLLKLPLDEGMLDIDANTRNITIPASFIKSSIVQRDKVAETVIFTIDRYIDNVDLCNVDYIYVQWSAPDGVGGVREWATPVELIDRESIPEKIKFGWTIDEAVTLFPGKVSFSVAFFINDENETGKVSYRLNTLPATLEIKPALQPEINSGSTINRPGSALNAAIRNNRYPGQGIKAPITPEFNEPGLDLPAEEMLTGSGSGTLTLRAQAVANDEGTIGYTWYFIPENGEFKYRCGAKAGETSTYSFPFKAFTDENVERKIKREDFILLTDTSKQLFKEYSTVKAEYELVNKEDAVLSYNNIGSVGVSYEVVSNIENLDPRERLYVQETSGVWTPYTGTPGQEELSKYKKYTTFTVSSTGRVVGEYFVEADNTIASNTSNPQSSTSCYLRGPEDIVILNDLEENLFIERSWTYDRSSTLTQSQYDLIINKNKDELFEKGTNEDGETIYNAKNNGTQVKIKNYSLEIGLRPTENTSFTYDWFRSLTEKESDEFTSSEKIAGQNSEALNISTLGWYKVDISAKKNREEKSNQSRVCRALEDPVKPTLEIVEYDEDNATNTSAEGTWKDLDEEGKVPYYDIDSRKNEVVKLVVNGTVDINGTDKQNDKLYSDGIKYEWRIYSEDAGSFVVLDTYQHGALLPSVNNPNFEDKSSTETFSNHPKAISYKYDGNPVQIACFAINTLYTRDTLNESVAVYFKIS